MKTLMVAAALVAAHVAAAQAGPVEILAGNDHLHYQHTLGGNVQEGSRWGWQHIATLIKRYCSVQKGALPDELMNQAYLTYRLHPVVSVKAGLFYTNAGGYRPTVGVQLMWRRERHTLVVNPRVDLVRHPSYELFALAEWRPRLTGIVDGYVRVQAMSNRGGAGHNRSYQQLRVGLSWKRVQAGAGITLDEYGPRPKVYANTGLFVRRVF